MIYVNLKHNARFKVLHLLMRQTFYTVLLDFSIYISLLKIIIEELYFLSFLFFYILLTVA
jgi:hypothetical protein